MAKKEEREQIQTLSEMKELLFKKASDEMDGYIEAKNYLDEEKAEYQHQRYVVIWCVIYDAGFECEFKDYRAKICKERTTTKK